MTQTRKCCLSSSPLVSSTGPKVTTATEGDPVSAEFNTAHADDHITEFPFQVKLTGDSASHRTHLPLHL